MSQEIKLLVLMVLFCVFSLVASSAVMARQPTPCYRPTEGPYFRGTNPCIRVPTLSKPYCPFPTN